MDNRAPQLKDDGEYAFAVHQDGTVTDLDEWERSRRHEVMTSAPPENGPYLNVQFSFTDRLKFAWRALRWPHAQRNALHFVQEAKTCLEEMEALRRSPFVNDIHKGVDLVGDAIEELERVEELLKFTQDY